MSRPSRMEPAYRHSVEVDSFRIMAECSVDVLCRITAEMRCIYCSPSAARILGWAPEEMLASFPRELIHPGDLLRVKGAHERYVSEQDASLAVSEARVRKHDGSFAWFELHACLVRDPAASSPSEVLLSMRDISTRVEHEKNLHVLAMTDGLTGLANRRAFDEALEREWRRAWRESLPLSLLLLDLDDFKGMNDTYGHQIGDECLRIVGATLHSIVRRPGDVVARFGGEELAVILPATDEFGAVTVAEQLRSAVEALQWPHRTNRAHGSVITLSVGCATVKLREGGRPTITAARFVEAADRSLFQAKAEGRNRVASTLLRPRLS